VLSERDNWLRAASFQRPEWIPCTVSLSPGTWKAYREDLERIVLAHPRIFPRGCVWKNVQEGLEGQVMEHPLADLSALASYQPPDPLVKEERGDRDWEQIAQEVEQQKKQGLLATGNGERLFDRLYFLRGFDRLMMDFATGEPRLRELIDMLIEYEMKLVNKWLELGVDMVGFHTDIGTQKSLMISPAHFRRYIKPMFTTLFQTCRDAGAVVYLSSDGRLLEIVDDLVECGVCVHDPQLRANTLDGIVRAYKGKLCANVDLDRQGFPFLSPSQLRDQVKEVVDRMAAPEGGLMVWAAFSGADVPLRNIVAVCEAMEDYCMN